MYMVTREQCCQTMALGGRGQVTGVGGQVTGVGECFGPP